MNNHIGGVIPSPKDKRDYKVRLDGVAGTPFEFEVSPLPDTKNQYAVGACVAFALSSVLEAIHNKKMSEGFIYGYRPIGYYQGIGMVPREACATVLKIGDTLKTDVPEVYEVDKMKELVMPFLDKLMPLAEPYKIKEYVNLQSVDEAKAFIMRYNLPIMYVHLYGGGLHAEMCYGWRGQYAKLLNSWGGDGRHEVDFKDFREMWGVVPVYEIKFPDVQKEQWFYDAVMWAAEKGLMGGFPDGTFKPDEPVTRAQLAVILERYANDISR